MAPAGWLQDRMALAKDDRLRIVLPEENAIVFAGDELRVAIGSQLEPPFYVSFRPEGAVSDFGEMLEGPSREKKFQVPQTPLGPYVITVSGRELVKTQIRVFANTKSALRSIALCDDTEVRCPPHASTNDIRHRITLAWYDASGRSSAYVQYVHVFGLYEDGVEREITRHPDTIYAIADPRIASAIGGEVTSGEPGKTILTVRHGSFEDQALIAIGVSGLRGDLNGNNDVDVDDMQVIRQFLGRAATGEGDPRDLDANGILDQSDVEALEKLCTRPQCATFEGRVTPL